MSDADLRRAAGPHVFVTDLDRPSLAADDRHHLSRSLRLRPGDSLTISDAAGGWRTATFGPEVEPSGPVQFAPPPDYEISLATALTKGSKPEFVVQKATEVGIDRILVFEATHSVVTWDEDRRGRALARLQRVAREAAMQSRRVWIPAVQILDDLQAVAEVLPIVRADFGGVATDSSHRSIAIGPEGGWSREERELIPTAIDLGEHVLRAETAAIVASTQMISHRRRFA